MNNKTMYFHCAHPAVDEDGNEVIKANGHNAKGVPTHTLGFRKVNSDTVIMGWSVAHSELDMYCRATGRNIADERVNAALKGLAEELPAVEIDELAMDLELEDDDEGHPVSMNLLPYHIWADGFDDYLSNAMNMIFTEDERESGVDVMFMSVDDVLCSFSVNFSDEGDEDITNEKIDTDETSAYVYSSFTNDDGEVIVHVQNRADFKANGYSDDVNDDMVAILGPVVDDGGFVVISQQQPILCHEDWEEIEVVRYLKSSGLSWSEDLETVVLEG